MICKHCGANLTPQEKICSYCRCYVEETPPPPQPVQNMQMQNIPQQFPANMQNYPSAVPPTSKRKSTALLLCLFGFFGFGGLHRFYTGKFWSGVLFFCTGGLSYIGTVIDLISIITGKFTDKDGKPIQ